MAQILSHTTLGTIQCILTECHFQPFVRYALYLRNVSICWTLVNQLQPGDVVLMDFLGIDAQHIVDSDYVFRAAELAARIINSRR